MSANDSEATGLSPETMALFKQLEQYYNRIMPLAPARAPATATARATAGVPPKQPSTKPKRRWGPRNKPKDDTPRIPEHLRPGGRRALLVGRDLPATSEMYGLKHDQWKQWLWRIVLREAISLLAEVGPSGFTVKEVAKRCGIARSTMYKYFGTKAELLSFCRIRFLDGQDPAHAQATERSAYRIALESIVAAEQQGDEGPLVADLLTEYVVAAAKSPERNLWLLTAAETTRARSPSQFGPPGEEDNPLRAGMRHCLTHMLNGGRGLETDADTINTITYVLEAITWYEASLLGPSRLQSPRRRRELWPRIINFNWLRMKPGLPRPRTAGVATERLCRQAIGWLLDGAGIGELRWPHLPPLKAGKLPAHVRQQHPTGTALHKLQEAARQVDWDDRDALHPVSFPQSMPLDPPPPLPCGLQGNP